MRMSLQKLMSGGDNVFLPLLTGRLLSGSNFERSKHGCLNNYRTHTRKSAGDNPLQLVEANRTGGGMPQIPPRPFPRPRLRRPKSL